MVFSSYASFSLTLRLDFHKASDKVPHGKLILQLEKLGLPSELIMWARCYLSNHKQFVGIGNRVSEILSVNSGKCSWAAIFFILMISGDNRMSPREHKLP